MAESRGGSPPFAAALAAAGLVPTPSSTPARTEATQWLVRYAQYLEHVCGTAPSTRTAYLRIATRLLAALFGVGRVQWHTVSAQALRTYKRERAIGPHLLYPIE